MHPGQMIILFPFLFLVSPLLRHLSCFFSLFLAIVDHKEELRQNLHKKVGESVLCCEVRPKCHDQCWEFLMRLWFSALTTPIPSQSRLLWRDCNKHTTQGGDLI